MKFVVPSSSRCCAVTFEHVRLLHVLVHAALHMARMTGSLTLRFLQAASGNKRSASFTVSIY